MAEALDEMGARTLWDHFATIPDRRCRNGRQYGLPAVLTLSLAAMLSGANDLRAVFRWGRGLPPEALFLLGLERAPCHATYHYFFKTLDVAATEAVLGALLAIWHDHWLIENRLHWRRDVILGEDDSRIRTGASPQAMAALRNAMLHLVEAAPEPLRAMLPEQIQEIVAQSTGSRTAKPIYHVFCSPDPTITDNAAARARFWALFEAEFDMAGQHYCGVVHRRGDRTHEHRVYGLIQSSGKAVSLAWDYARQEKCARIVECEFGMAAVPSKHARAIAKRLRQDGRRDVADWLVASGTTLRERPVAHLTPQERMVSERTGVDLDDPVRGPESLDPRGGEQGHGVVPRDLRREWCGHGHCLRVQSGMRASSLRRVRPVSGLDNHPHR